MVLNTPNHILHPIYHNSFILYRVSPLFTGFSEPLCNASLSGHAQRFREILAGEVLRGVPAGSLADQQVWNGSGALKTVTWRNLPDNQALRDTMSDDRDTDKTASRPDRGILVTISYEKTTYWAILLHHQQKFGNRISVAEDDGFHFFPLLMIKMPAILRKVFIRFLAKTFDARISNLHLSSQNLIDVFEKFIVNLAENDNTRAELAEVLGERIKDTTISIGFSIPDGSALLKTLEIRIVSDDVSRIIAQQRKTADAPFFAALSIYLKKHLALDLWNPQVRVVRIACGAFIIAADGRLKLTQPLDSTNGDAQRRATENTIEIIIEAAIGSFMSPPP